MFFIDLLIVIPTLSELPEQIKKHEVEQNGKKVEVLILSIDCDTKNYKHIEIFYNGRTIPKIHIDYNICKKNNGDKIYMKHLEKCPNIFLPTDKSVLLDSFFGFMLCLMGIIFIFGSLLLPDL